MGTLFGFVVGYIVGARAGSQGFEEVVDALRTVRDSEEFQALGEVVRAHVKGAAGTLGRWLTDMETHTAEEMLERARDRARRP
jgi:hypothetical protein